MTSRHEYAGAATVGLAGTDAMHAFAQAKRQLLRVNARGRQGRCCGPSVRPRPILAYMDGPSA
jgi:hypothetical protein